VFEMAAPIQSPDKCDVRFVIRFLNAKRERPAEIHKQIVAVYGNVMNRQNMTKWCREFSEGMTDVHDEQRSGRSSLISDDFLQEIEGEIHTNRRVMIREMHHFNPEVSKTKIHEVVTEELGYRKLYVRWVPKILTDDHKTKLMGPALKFLARYAEEGDDFLDSILAGDETWSFHHTPDSKQHFDDDDEVQEEVKTWFKWQVAYFYDWGIWKLVPRLNKYLDNAGDYVLKNKVMDKQLIHSAAFVN
jgi:hypothetical protein